MPYEAAVAAAQADGHDHLDLHHAGEHSHATPSSRAVAATLDTNTYQRDIKITDKEMKAFEARHLHRHDFHGNWNYTIKAEPPGHDTPERPDIIVVRVLSLRLNL